MKTREQYLIDEFKDFTGKTREFTFCAITVESDADTTELYNYAKAIYIGVSVCNHGDTYNEEMGKSIARNKALTNPIENMFASEKITFNHDTVEAILKSYADYFKKDPGIFIAGYNTQKKEYLTDPETFEKKRKFYEEKEKKILELQKELKKVKGSRFQG